MSVKLVLTITYCAHASIYVYYYRLPQAVNISGDLDALRLCARV